MNRERYSRILFSLIVGGLVLVGLLLVLNGASQPALADEGDLFASTTGGGTSCSQSNPCGLQTALRQADDGDAIYVAAGTYRGAGTAVISISKSVILRGGWDGTATGPVVRDPDAHQAIVDGESDRRVVYVGEGITPTLDGFVITGGNATGLVDDCFPSGGNPDGCGGGIFAFNSHPIIINNTIRGNVAALDTFGFPTGTTGYGGGAYLRNTANAIVSGNRIVDNVASTANCGNGGGLVLRASLSSAAGMRVEGNEVLGNVATTVDTLCAWGGGIAGGPDGVLIQSNRIEGNRANGAGTGAGAGLYQWIGSAEYLDNALRENEGSSAVYLGYSRSLFAGNWILDNPSGTGIALIYGDGPGPTLVNNVIARSGSQWTLSAKATLNNPLTVHLLHNTLVGTGAGNGVQVQSDHVTMALTNTIVAGHAWGITTTHPTSSVVLSDHTLFWSNDRDGVRGPTPVDGDPRFVDPDGGDYHLRRGSAAIDAGVPSGVSTDIDGDPRPGEGGYDIGADECTLRHLFLPLALKAHP